MILFLCFQLCACQTLNTNHQDMKYSPCKNNETEEKVRQQYSALSAEGRENQNITVDCAATELPSTPVIMFADTQ